MLRRYNRFTKKNFEGSRIRGFQGIVGVGLIFVLWSSPGVWAGDFKPAPTDRQEVEKAARRYLEGEVRRDLPGVFNSLYPHSDYRKAKDYQAYVTEAQSSPVRIQSYEILRIVVHDENPDKNQFPNLEGFARVEVDLIIEFVDKRQKSFVNFDFPFVKEGGIWYKL